MNVALRPQPDALNLISLCTGGGGLDRAVELAIPTARPIVCVERESFSVASLVAQIENGLMAPAAVWSNVRTFNGRRFRGLVDGLIGGIPCQGHSLAGRRQGSHDERDLWSPARRIIAQARPWFVLIENVGGMLSAGADEVPGADRVRRDLRKLGYSSTLVVVRADQMGLPHERLRVFILGVADWFRADCDSQHGHWTGHQRTLRGRQSTNCRDGVADSIGEGLERCRSTGNRPGERPSSQRSGERLGDTERSRRQATGRGHSFDPGTEPQSRSCNMGHASDRDGARPWQSEAHHEGAREGLHRGSGSAVVDAFGGGRSGRPEGAIGEPLGRTVEQQPSALRDEQRLADGHCAEPAAQRRDVGEVRGLSEGEGGPKYGAALSRGGRPFLRPPGPGDFDAWRHVALVAPDLLPAVSRYDRLRLEMGAQGLVAHGDPSSGTWLDPQTGARVHSTILQAATERAFRGVADVMAPRIDELRMLGNGVVDAQGALAVRIGAHDLAARGSAGAALLVRMMEQA